MKREAKGDGKQEEERRLGDEEMGVKQNSGKKERNSRRGEKMRIDRGRSKRQHTPYKCEGGVDIRHTVTDP